MKKGIRRQHAGILLTLAGIILLSLNFVSYLMDSAFVSLLLLPVGILLLVSGIYVMNAGRKKIRKEPPA